MGRYLFHPVDRLKLIGASKELVAAFESLLMGMGLCQGLAWNDQTLGAFEFKIRGSLWVAVGEATMTARLLLLRMLETSEAGGWSLYATVDQNDGRHARHWSTTGTDSWYCVLTVGWVPGNPIFHR